MVELKSFLILYNAFRRFVANFADIAILLIRNCEKDALFYSGLLNKTEVEGI